MSEQELIQFLLWNYDRQMRFVKASIDAGYRLQKGTWGWEWVK